MDRFGMRLMILGAVLVLGAGGYYVYEQRSPVVLETDNFIIGLHNDMIRGGVDKGRVEHRTAEEIVAAKQKRAYLPGGIGLLLIGIGWAALSAKGKAEVPADEG